jgi:hypothetical protein
VLTFERNRLSAINTAIPFVPISVSSLIRKGVLEDHIVKIANLLERFPDRDVESIIKDIEEIKRLQVSKGKTLSTQVQENTRDPNSQKVGEIYTGDRNVVDDHESNSIQRIKKVRKEPRLSSVLFLKAEIQRMSRTSLSSEKVDHVAGILWAASRYVSMHDIYELPLPLDLLYWAGSAESVLEFAN